MAENDADAAGLDVMDIFDDTAGPHLVCRVCGSLVAAAAPYLQAHYDWHEASHGA